MRREGSSVAWWGGDGRSEVIMNRKGQECFFEEPQPSQDKMKIFCSVTDPQEAVSNVQRYVLGMTKNGCGFP